jgi:hypothetical protein
LWAVKALFQSKHFALGLASTRYPPTGAAMRSLIKFVATGVISMFALTSAAASGPFNNTWSSDSESRFEHVIADAPGRITLTLKARTTTPGVETVAVYFMDKNGNKSLAWRLTVIASRAGESNSKSFVMAKPKPTKDNPDPKTNSVKVLVAVENASRRVSSGEYTLSVSRS